MVPMVQLAQADIQKVQVDYRRIHRSNYDLEREVMTEELTN